MKHNLPKKFIWACLGALLTVNTAPAATYVAVSTANGIDEYVVNGSSWTYDHQIVSYTGLYGVTYNPADGLLYAVDAVANQIFSVDPTNGTQTILATLGDNTPGWTADNPQNIAFGPDGKLYFSTAFGTPTSQGVFSLNPDGSDFAQFIPPTGTGWTLGRARDLAWAGTNLFVTSRDNNNVYEFDSTGALVGTGPVNSAAVTGASSLYADTDSSILYVGGNQSGVNSIRTLDISGPLPVAPGSATDSGGKVNSIGIIKVGGTLFYITFNSGTSSHGAIYRLNADKTSTVVVADLGATANDFTVMGTASTGPLESVAVQLPRTSMMAGTFQQATVLANYLLISNDVSADPGTAYSSDNTNVLTVSSSGKINAVSVGAANVIATYSGQSATNLVTVIPPTVTLIHRFGFTNDASDAIGNIYGTVYGSDYAFTGGQLAFMPTSQYDYSYADFGPYAAADNNGLTFDALTFEAWATFGTNYTWARLFDFGNSDGINGTSYVMFSPHSSSGTARAAILTPTGGEADVDAPGILDNQTNVHVVVVFHPLAGYIKLYLNGILAAENTNVTGQDLANVADYYSYLGKSQFFADPAANLSVDEFRIYSGALTATNVAFDYAAGPNQLVSNPGAVQSLSLVINTNMSQQGGQSIVAYANFANVAGVPVNNFPGISFTSDNTNVLTVSADGAVKAVGFGAAAITVSYSGQTLSDTVNVTPLPQARFLVADGGNNRVLLCDATGTNWNVAAVFAAGAYDGLPLSEPTGLAQDAAGNVYVSEGVAGGRVLKFNSHGACLGTIGADGVDFTGTPGYLALDPNGNVYLSTPFTANTIVKYDATGHAWSVFVPATDSATYTLNNPIGIAFDPNGNLYVCNRGSFNAANRSIVEFDTNGVYVPNPNTGLDFATGLVGPQGLTWDAANNRFLVTVGATQISAVDTNGIVTPLSGAVGADILSAATIGTNVFFSDYSGTGVYALTGFGSATLVAGGIAHAHQMLPSSLAPDLNISLNGTNALISWPYSVSPFHLKSSASLNPADWQDVTTPAAQNGNVMQTTLPLSDDTKFFRLSH